MVEVLLLLKVLESVNPWGSVDQSEKVMVIESVNPRFQ
jgi:hypothetical protein